MIVEVVRTGKSYYWYADRIGDRFTVNEVDGRYQLPDDPRFISVNDALVVEDTKDTRDGLVLIAPGSRGKIGEISILITQVHIESRQVEYTVSWWCEGRRYSERVPEYEITDADKTMEVKFK